MQFHQAQAVIPIVCYSVSIEAQRAIVLDYLRTLGKFLVCCVN